MFQSIDSKKTYATWNQRLYWCKFYARVVSLEYLPIFQAWFESESSSDDEDDEDEPEMEGAVGGTSAVKEEDSYEDWNCQKIISR